MAVWPVDSPAFPVLLLLLALYFAGISRAWLQAGFGKGISVRQALSFVAGTTVMGAALLSPIETLSGLLFSAHMLQHVLLMLVAAPLLVLGAPGLAYLWLLPVEQRRGAMRLGKRAVRPLRGLLSPAGATLLFALVTWLWHLPTLYQAALQNELLHLIEHFSFVAAAALFWNAVLRPFGGAGEGGYVAPLLLFVTAAHGSALGLLITVSGSTWYGHYDRVAQAAGFSALEDQQLAGLIMWVPPGGIYLLVALWAFYRAMSGTDRRRGGLRAGRSRLPILLVPALLALLGSSYGLAQHGLAPVGPGARGILLLFWVMLIIALAVCVLVFVLLYFAVRGGRNPGARGWEDTSRQSKPVKGRTGRLPLGGGPFVVLGGIVLPLVVLVPLLIWTLDLSANLVAPAEDHVVIEIEGYQWWWAVRYPDYGIVDANQIRIPVDTPVQLVLTSADVIHSFWAPGLAGKMDLVPGNTNHLWIEANETGVYTAVCAEYCGTQHANMRMLIIAEPRESFEEWMSERQEPSGPPVDELARQGREVFMNSPCIGCHTIRGTEAQGVSGPDLTHLASRLTLGAGTVANNRGNLGGWVSNSQGLKPGNLMPPMNLESEDLLALLAYLETLE